MDAYFSITPTPAGKWQVTVIETGTAFGDPFETMEEAVAFVREAEAMLFLDKLTACRGAGCSI